MSRLINGEYNCPIDGPFKWNGYLLDNGFKNYQSIDWNNNTKNFIHANIFNNKLQIQIICPKCKKKYFDYSYL